MEKCKRRSLKLWSDPDGVLDVTLSEAGLLQTMDKLV